LEKRSERIGSGGTSVDVGLGYYEDIHGLFSFGKYGPRLEDAITFVFSQSLQRDMFFGAWAMGYRAGDGEYRVKITSPCDDVSSYETHIREYVEAGKEALSTYYEKIPYRARRGWDFLLPFGLAMANVQSIQLLHFPPLETFTYKDYLYSPTNRRWECLLAQNGFDGARNTLLERIVDIAPVAAPGGAGKAFEPYNRDFVGYVKRQLNNFLRPLDAADGEVTQPIVAYGGPVHEWLPAAFPDQVTSPPHTMDLLQLSIVDRAGDDSGAKTWVLCAHHPSQYLYDTDLPLSQAFVPQGEYAAPAVVMCQDLVAARWQAHMVANPGADPQRVLDDAMTHWGWDKAAGTVTKDEDKRRALLAAMAEQNHEFSYVDDTPQPTPAQAAATQFAIQRSAESDRYSVWAFEPLTEEPFAATKTSRSASFDSHRRLMQVGGYLVAWGVSGDEAHYSLIPFDRNSGNPLAEKEAGYGYWKKNKFFSDYRPNFGADFDQLELIGLPGYVLSVIPAPGRRTYQLWSFDPQADRDCLSKGPFQQGGFRDIPADHELLAIADYVLDRKGSSYRVWSFDPQSSPPLALPAVQDGTWTAIDDSDAMAAIGEWVVTWKRTDPSAGCRIWRFDPTLSDPLGGEPVNTCALPEGFDAGSTLSGVLPPAPQDAGKATTPGTIEFMREKIEHVVYYMLESRSFDNVLGWLYERGRTEGLNWIGGREGGFRGVDTSMSNTLPDGSAAKLSKYEEGKLSEAFVLGGPAQDPWHNNSDVLMQLFHGYVGYAKRREPTMDGFAWNQNSGGVMSTFTPEQLSVLNGLAAHFAVSDEWFGSLPGGTDVNRGFSVSGSAYDRLGTWEGGKPYEDWPDTPHRQSIWKVLWSHGHRDWKIYYSILWGQAVFSYQLYLKGQIPEVDWAWAAAEGDMPTTDWIAPYDQFKDDVRCGRLPRFSYIEPAWVGKACTSYHPGSSKDGLISVVPGERALNDIYETLTARESIWSKTLLVVTFDKNGGLFDHVPPPYASKPWPHDEVDGFAFDLLGPRVPAVFASPWIKPNTVLRPGKDGVFESTSFAATLLDWYGIPRGTWGLGDRMPRVSTIERVFTEREARETAPTLTVPYDKDFPKGS